MKFSPIEFNNAIERWLKKQEDKAPDKEYALSFLKKDIEKINKWISHPESIIHTAIFKKAYNYYRRGDRDELENLFSNDTSIIGLLTIKQREDLLKNNLVQLIPAKKSKPIKIDKKGKKILPDFLFSVDQFIIKDKKLIVEIFKTYKIYIFYLEVIRKLEHLSDKRKIEKPVVKIDSGLEFENLFVKSEYAEPSLEILMELERPVIDSYFNYIGSNKGIFGAWLRVLKQSKTPIITNLKNTQIKNILNAKINGLSLSKEAKELGNTYKKATALEIEIEKIFSKFSKNGKFGK